LIDGNIAFVRQWFYEMDVAMVVAGNFAAGGTDPAGIVSNSLAKDGLNKRQRSFSTTTAGNALENK
jgi:hypothetical protein